MQISETSCTDIRLSLLTLRALWDRGDVAIVGLILSVTDAPAPRPVFKRRWSSVPVLAAEASSTPQPEHAEDAPSPEEDHHKVQLEEVRTTLRDVGLGHLAVRMGVSSSRSASASHLTTTAEHLREVYEATNYHVTLVLEGPCTSVDEFAQEHKLLFREKTVRLIHMGGAHISPGRASTEYAAEQSYTGENLLSPDPAATQIQSDMEAAERFYWTVQELMVPFVIISRHTVLACRLPRTLFDTLGESGGIGKLLAEEQAETLRELFRKACAAPGTAARGNLPKRCDRRWFLKQFCNGSECAAGEDVWPHVKLISVYAPISVLAAVPKLVVEHFDAVEVSVRSAPHKIIGLTTESTGIKNVKELRSFLCQCIMKGAVANRSDFGSDLVARSSDIDLSPESKEFVHWKFDPRDRPSAGDPSDPAVDDGV